MIIAGYRDSEGNWIENFTSQPYNTEEQARWKIRQVYNEYVVEGGSLGWTLNGEPRVEPRGGKYVAIIPLKRYEQGAKQQYSSRF